MLFCHHTSRRVVDFVLRGASVRLDPDAFTRRNYPIWAMVHLVAAPFDRLQIADMTFAFSSRLKACYSWEGALLGLPGSSATDVPMLSEGSLESSCPYLVQWQMCLLPCTKSLSMS